MTFETTLTGNTWTYSDSRMGGRREDVRKGVYVIDHRDTGRMIIGYANNVSKEVDNHLQKLTKGTHPIRRLQLNYNEEINRADKPQSRAVMVITEYPIKSDKEIQQTIHEIRTTHTANYCLLN